MDCIGKKFKIAINRANYDGIYFMCITNLDTNQHYPTFTYARNMPVNFIDENGVKYCDIQTGAFVSDYGSKWFSTYAKKTKIGDVTYDANVHKCLKLNESNFLLRDCFSDVRYEQEPSAWEQTKAYYILEIGATLNLYVNGVQVEQIDMNDTEINKVVFNGEVVFEN